MKTFLVWLTLATCLISPGWSAPKLKQPRSSAKAPTATLKPLRLRNTCVAVCSIVQPTTKRPLGFARGSGFFVTPHHVLTCYHLLSVPSPFGPVPADQVLVEWADGRQCQARVVATERYHDLALLEVTNCRWRGAPAPLVDFHCEHGVSVRVAGLFDPSGFWVTHGHVTGCNVLDGFAIADAKVRSGFSGGPVFDDRANVVGIVSQRDDARNAIFVRSDIILQFLEAAGVAIESK